ncbi:MAG: acyl-CoA dehydrogenase [Christensenellales bacterium]
MNFKLSEEHIMLRDFYRDFAQKEVKPLAGEIDEQERFPQETVEKMARLGMLGIPFSNELGGQGCDNLAYILCVEELSKVCAATGVIVETHTSLGCEPIKNYGTPAQISKYLRPLVSGKKLGAFGLTEPNAGSDLSGIETQAVMDGGHYILNGSKIFISNGGEADIYIIFAMTDKSQGTRGLSAFIVEKGFPGFSFGKNEKKMGIRGSSARELIFENCMVPKENLLGQEGKGFGIALKTLDGGRIGIAAQALGIAEGAFNEGVRYAKERVQFGKPIASFQNTQFRFADMKCKIDCAQFLVYRAAVAKDAGENYTDLAAMAKLYASEAAMDITTKCVQIFGGYGYTREYPVERMMRDAKITEIYEGTNEVQRMVIAAGIFK